MQSRSERAEGLERVRQAAARDPSLRFTSLLHHVNVDLLRSAFYSLKRKAAPGVDGVTWESYLVNLEENLQDLHGRLHRGAYRPHPSERRYIPKPDGGQRPLGIAALEDKVAQRAVAAVLSAIYEVDFYDFSYGFRPQRNCHKALDALAYVIKRRKVNWVLEADIRGYFDSICPDRLVRFLERRVGDKRVLRIIQKWLWAGVLEDGIIVIPETGTPQGSGISPILANVYLHYVLDEWAVAWRKQHSYGEFYIVRYADDFVVATQRQGDAERFLADLDARMKEHRLELHDAKTRILEFGRFAAVNRKVRGQGKPETFDFLGFTHICGKSRRGKFLLVRHTIKKRLRNKLKAIKDDLRKRRHCTIADQGLWLSQVLDGYFQYFAVPGNGRTLDGFRTAVARLWLLSLRRRSQRHRLGWDKFARIVDHWLPKARDRHPMPDERFCQTLTHGKSPVR